MPAPQLNTARPTFLPPQPRSKRPKNRTATYPREKCGLERYRSLQQDRARKVRSALYSRIEKWAEDEGQTPVDWSDCPVCETDLADP